MGWDFDEVASSRSEFGSGGGVWLLASIRRMNDCLCFTVFLLPSSPPSTAVSGPRLSSTGNGGKVGEVSVGDLARACALDPDSPGGGKILRSKGEPGRSTTPTTSTSPSTPALSSDPEASNLAALNDLNVGVGDCDCGDDARIGIDRGSEKRNAPVLGLGLE